MTCVDSKFDFVPQLTYVRRQDLKVQIATLMQVIYAIPEVCAVSIEIPAASGDAVLRPLWRNELASSPPPAVLSQGARDEWEWFLDLLDKDFCDAAQRYPVEVRNFFWIMGLTAFTGTQDIRAVLSQLREQNQLSRFTIALQHSFSKHADFCAYIFDRAKRTRFASLFREMSPPTRRRSWTDLGLLPFFLLVCF